MSDLFFGGEIPCKYVYISFLDQLLTNFGCQYGICGTLTYMGYCLVLQWLMLSLFTVVI